MRSPEARAELEAENDRIWGKGNWVQCEQCPKDAEDEFSYHHVKFHEDDHVDAAAAERYARVRALQSFYGFPENIAEMLDKQLMELWPPRSLELRWDG